VTRWPGDQGTSGQQSRRGQSRLSVIEPRPVDSGMEYGRRHDREPVAGRVTRSLDPAPKRRGRRLISHIASEKIGRPCSLRGPTYAFQSGAIGWRTADGSRSRGFLVVPGSALRFLRPFAVGDQQARLLVIRREETY